MLLLLSTQVWVLCGSRARQTHSKAPGRVPSGESGFAVKNTHRVPPGEGVGLELEFWVTPPPTSSSPPAIFLSSFQPSFSKECLALPLSASPPLIIPCRGTGWVPPSLHQLFLPRSPVSAQTSSGAVAFDTTKHPFPLPGLEVSRFPGSLAPLTPTSQSSSHILSVTAGVLPSSTPGPPLSSIPSSWGVSSPPTISAVIYMIITLRSTSLQRLSL